MRLPRLFLLPLAAVLAAPSAPAAQRPWEAKVDPWVLSTAAAGRTEFLVFLKEQADVSGADALPTKEEKGRYVHERLSRTAARTQGPLLALLSARGAEHRPFWIANMIWVRGDQALIEELAQRPDVARLYANPTVRVQPPVESFPLGEAPQAIEWNVARIRAPELWTAGFSGQGVVIGGQDTGYDWDHPALRNKYRGWNGAAANHNYNWHDAIHVSNPDCPANSPEPCDDFGHGTHTMGTMIGDDGAGNQIGVAPGAKWIGCRNMNDGDGTPASYSECFQWFVAPTDLNNQNPNPALAPHVINNSWGCPPSEGCTDPNALLTVVQSTRAAGIMVVSSAGNSGPNCHTVDDPPAIYQQTYAVGSTTNTADDAASSFSSRGTVTVDGSNRIKPDVSAPGSGVRSSVPGTGYAGMSGTSMAAPHVAGAVALVLSAFPQLAGSVAQLETILSSTAVPRTSAQTCGGVPGTQIPNTVYGHGRLDVYNALVSRSADLSVTTPPWPVVILTNVARTYTMTVANAGPLPATAIALDQPWPASVTVGTVTPSQGNCTVSAGVIDCSLGTLAPSAAATVTVTITPTQPAVLQSRITVTAAEFDVALANNTRDILTFVEDCPPATPSITAPLSAPPDAPGLQATVPTAPGHNYVWTLTGGTITAGQSTGTLTFTAGPAGTTMRLSVVDSVAGCDSQPGRRNVQVHFLDVPPGHAFHNHVNTLARNEVTGGCGGGNYCPDASVTREQMAVFLLRAKEGAGYVPPACATPMFNDVPCSSPFARWVNELATRGVTTGCGGGNYCPLSAVTREQMAVFLLKTLEPPGYVPPACVTPAFGDVPCSSPFARWINELAARGITGGCGGGNYCPASPNTRGQMAVFVVATFGLN
jgi:subtilisin family serine protease